MNQPPVQLGGLVAKDIMTTDVVSVASNSSLFECTKVLQTNGITGAPVLDDGELVGVISRTDITRCLVAESNQYDQLHSYYWQEDGVLVDFYASLAADSQAHSQDLNTIKVRSVMSPQVASVTPDCPITEVAQILLDKKYHRLMVCEGKNLRGIVSVTDFVRLALS